MVIAIAFAAAVFGSLLMLFRGDGSRSERISEYESVYYRRCADARADGAAPIKRGEPGYRPGLDADHDGIACEPLMGY